MAQIGFLGLGIMGYPMARHLVKSGHDVALWSNTGAKAHELAKEGKARVCSTPKEVADSADFIFYCVGNTDMARAITTGAAGLIEGVRQGAVIEAKSTDPDIRGTRRCLEMMAAHPRLSTVALQTVGVKGLDGFAMAVVLR